MLSGLQAFLWISIKEFYSFWPSELKTTLPICSLQFKPSLPAFNQQFHAYIKETNVVHLKILNNIKKKPKMYNTNIWSGSVLFIPKTLLLAFLAKAPAGKTKTPNLQIGLAKDQYKMRYTCTLPSVRRQSWPTKSYGHNGDSKTTSTHQNTRLDRQQQRVTSMEGLLCICFGWAAIPPRCISAACPSICQQT